MRSFRRAAFLVGLIASAGLPARAQTAALSLRDIVDLLSNSVSSARVEQRAKQSCISFPMDAAAEATLTKANATRDLIASLKTTCFAGAILEVVSDPAGADVFVDQRPVGKTPYRTRIDPNPGLRIQVRSGQSVQNYLAVIPAGNEVRVSFEMLEDTVPLPPDRTAQQIAEDLGVMRQWTPSIPRPEEPRLSSAGGGVFGSVIAGLGGAVAGFAIASASPAPCHDKQVAAQDSYVGDKLYRAGTTVDLGVKSGCAFGIGAGAGVASSLIASQLFRARSRARLRDYEAAKSAYPSKLSQWEGAISRERAAWLSTNEQVKSALAKQAEDARRFQSTNDQIKRRNSSRQLPTAVNTPITATTPLNRR